MSESFEQIQYRLLMKSCESLRVFLKAAPPDKVLSGGMGIGFGAVIGMTLALIVKRAAGVYGLVIYEKLGEVAVESERRRLGFCVSCKENPNPAQKDHVLCEACIASVTADEKELSQS